MIPGRCRLQRVRTAGRAGLPIVRAAAAALRMSRTGPARGPRVAPTQLDAGARTRACAWRMHGAVAAGEMALAREVASPQHADFEVFSDGTSDEGRVGCLN